MIVLIPMAGLSSRFFDAGFDKPKYMLPLGRDNDVFDQVMLPFLCQKNVCKFIFIYRDIFETKKYLEKKIKDLKISSAKLVKLDHFTSGQAETALYGLDGENPDSSIVIFNIDTFHLNLDMISFDTRKYSDYAGVLEVFQDNGSNWSFAKVDKDGDVVKTAEKDPISNLASNGMYYFRSVRLYQDLFELAFNERKDYVQGEAYIAPMYNHLIKAGYKVRVKQIEKSDIIFCGTPDEYRKAKREKKMGAY